MSETKHVKGQVKLNYKRNSQYTILTTLSHFNYGFDKHKEQFKMSSLKSQKKEKTIKQKENELKDRFLRGAKTSGEP
jgi:hypothetical protein